MAALCCSISLVELIELKLAFVEGLRRVCSIAGRSLVQRFGQLGQDLRLGLQRLRRPPPAAAASGRGRAEALKLLGDLLELLPAEALPLLHLLAASTCACCRAALDLLPLLADSLRTAALLGRAAAGGTAARSAASSQLRAAPPAAALQFRELAAPERDTRAGHSSGAARASRCEYSW